MKKIICLLSFLIFVLIANAQYKKDGTPDMRYKANKEVYGTTPSYSQPSYYTSPTVDYSLPTKTRNYNNSRRYKLQNGYYKRNGTYVPPHIKTSPDNYKWNNKNSK